MIVAGDLRTVARTCRAALEPFRDGDWDGPAADLEWSRRATLAHLLAALTFYSVNLATRSEEPRSGGQANDSMDIEHLLDALEGRAEVLAVVCEAAPPEARGGHEYGRSDPEGFVAMAVGPEQRAPLVRHPERVRRPDRTPAGRGRRADPRSSVPVGAPRRSRRVEHVALGQRPGPAGRPPPA